MSKQDVKEVDEMIAADIAAKNETEPTQEQFNFGKIMLILDDAGDNEVNISAAIRLQTGTVETINAHPNKAELEAKVVQAAGLLQELMYEVIKFSEENAPIDESTN